MPKKPRKSPEKAPNSTTAHTTAHTSACSKRKTSAPTLLSAPKKIIAPSGVTQFFSKVRQAASTFTRSPAFRQQIRSSMVDALIHDEDGLATKVVQYPMDQERTERFIIRTTKGLLKHHFPHYDSSQDRWFTHHLGWNISELAQFEPLRDELPRIEHLGDGVFTYRFDFLADGKTGIWFLVFYDTVIFFVTHSSSKTLYEGVESDELSPP